MSSECRNNKKKKILDTSQEVRTLAEINEIYKIRDAIDFLKKLPPYIQLYYLNSIDYRITDVPFQENIMKLFKTLQPNSINLCGLDTNRFGREIRAILHQQVVEVNLSGYNIESLVDFLARLPHLRKLYLSNCPTPIIRFTGIIAAPLPALEYLDFSNSKIETVHIQAPELRILILANCYVLRTLKARTAALEHINVDNCEKLSVNWEVPTKLKDFSCKFTSTDPEITKHSLSLSNSLTLTPSQSKKSCRDSTILNSPEK